MSTKALVTIRHNGLPVAFLHSEYDGNPVHVGVSLLGALSECDSLRDISDWLTGTPFGSSSHFKWTEFESQAAVNVPRLESQFKYDLNLKDTDAGLAVDSVKVTDIYRPRDTANGPSRSFEGSAGDYFLHVTKDVSAMRDAAFKEGAEGKGRLLAELAGLNRGLVATSPARPVAPSAPFKPVSGIQVSPKKTLLVGAKLSPVQEIIAYHAAAALRSQGHSNFSKFVFGKLPGDLALLVKLGQRSVEIAYDRHLDLYDIKKHVVNQKTFEAKTTEHKGLNSEQMAESLKHLVSLSRAKSGNER